MSPVNHTGLYQGYGKEKKETTSQNAEEKRWVFSFDLKEESEEGCLTEKGRKFQMTGPMY